MKQYVLDEPGARPPQVAAPPGGGASRSRWRWPVVLAALAAVGLVAARSFVDDAHPPAPPRAVETAVVPAYVAPAAVESPPAPVAAPVAALPAPPMPAALPPSRVTRSNGRYVVDLHGAAVGQALEMLSDATRTTVSGSDVVSASPARINASFVAGSPLDAWKGVFGDLASFAMSCGPSGCAVRFVSLVGERSTSLSSSLPHPAPPTSLAPPAAGDSVQADGMADN